MAAQPSMETFDAYFRRADLDKDGRISGPEAVAFFQGSNLPKHVLAQIWMHADQNRTGFLGRAEFYNALKLVTVAQSGRELTADIVKAALYGPAAAKIPAPQINSVSSSTPSLATKNTPQLSPVVPPTPQMGFMGSTVTQTPGVRGPQAFPGTHMSQQFSSSLDGNLMRPSQSTPTSVSLPTQGPSQVFASGGSITGPRLPGSNAPNLSTDWLGNRTGGASVGGASHDPVRGLTTSVSQDGLSGAGLGAAPRPQVATTPASPLPSKPVDSVLSSIQPNVKDPKPSAVSGNGFSSDSLFGSDMFSTTSQAKQGTAAPTFAISSVPNTSSGASVAASPQNLNKTSQLGPLQSKPPLPPSGHLQQAQSVVKQTQLDTVQRNSTPTMSNVSVASGNYTPNQSQLPWPKITQSDIQKYTAVFVKVDKDRDGKITGEEARNLFLSWRLPREVLKQVWDLSDQDSDSMLSLREFCTALYLMERYREGRSLPSVLPNSIRFDETLLIATNQQQTTAYSGSAWQPSLGLSQQGTPGSRAVTPSSVTKPPVQTTILSQAEDAELPVQQKSKVPVLEKHLIDQLSNEEQSALNSKFQEAADAEKKVQELEKEILESKEKTEFYHNKMQELVLYKSRCDNRLNEVTERASADRREVELLAKKYEEKYKQIGGGVGSKLTLEEATFRDIQERKLELYNAIVKMGQGATADDALQGRVDRIESDLEELVKALNERCKQYGLRAKPTSLVELPFGWQPGVQGGAADWSEDWDKFEEEGFAIVKELTVEVETVVADSKPKSPAVQSDKTSKVEISPASSTNDDSKAENPSSNGEQAPEDESMNDHSDDESARSPLGSPRKSATETQSQDHNSSPPGIQDNSPRTKDTHSDHGGAESTISGDKFADEHPWGATFDASDDTDSVWGLSAINTKENDYEKSGQSSFFDYGEFSVNPIKTDSPSAASVFGKERSPFFDSVPSTPMYNTVFSPKFNEGPDDHFSSSISRFDSFNMHDSGLFTQHESVARFDSFRSTTDHGPSESFSRFDSMRSSMDHAPSDSFARFDSFRSTTDYARGESFARFDSMRSTADQGRAFPSFDDADPFGSTGPFKSSESHTPRKGNDNWSAF